MKYQISAVLFLLIIGGLIVFLFKDHNSRQNKTTKTNTDSLAIVTMRQKQYPGSTITIEQTLNDGPNYHRYSVSYLSEGLKIYGFLTVPFGEKPKDGWPLILFNHGYIPPDQYSTANSYAIMIDPLASAGYIVFASDYRGNDNSKGTPMQPYVSPDYVTDSMNALASIEKYKGIEPSASSGRFVDTNRIGVFGHSMGGNITLHELVMTQNIKAAEILSGVVGNETDLLEWWNRRKTNNTIVGNDLDTYYIVEQMIQQHGTPQTDPKYWNTVDPTKFVSNISAPVQIQVGTADNEVPMRFSTSLRDALKSAGKTVSYHEYPGADHNVSPDTSQAMEQTIQFFNTYLK